MFVFVEILIVLCTSGEEEARGAREERTRGAGSLGTAAGGGEEAGGTCQTKCTLTLLMHWKTTITKAFS